MGKPHFGVPSVSGASHGVLSAKWRDLQCPVYMWSEPQSPACEWVVTLPHGSAGRSKRGESSLLER